MNIISYAVLFILGLAISGCNAGIRNYNENYFSNPMEKTLPLENIQEVEAHAGIEVTVHVSNEKKAVIKSNYMDQLIIEKGNGKVTFSFDNPDGKIKDMKTTIDVYLPKVEGYYAHSGASILSSDKIKSDEMLIESHSGAEISGIFETKTMKIKAHSGSSIAATVETNELAVTVHSGADVTLSGEAKSASLNAHSSGNLDGKEFSAEEVSANAHSSGKIYIKVSKSLSTAAHSSGEIYYRTEGAISFSASRNSGGKVDTF